MNRLYSTTFSIFCLMLIALPFSCAKPDNNSSALDDWENILKPDEGLLPDDQNDDNGEQKKPWYQTIGLCFRWDDCSNPEVLDYIGIAKKSGINCFSVYNPPREGAKWKQFEKDCAEAGIDIEWEEHMMSYLLPRDYFAAHPEYYRMNEDGIRVNDCNGCPSSKAALDIVKKRAEFIGERYRSTNNRYYCWLDDNSDVCYCPSCKGLTPSDQALIFENAALEGLRAVNPDAMLAHLAYQRTLDAPRNVKPAEGIFLEFAPVDRNRYQPLSATWAVGVDERRHLEYLQALRDNLEVFPSETAQVLEYWLDASLFSSWNDKDLKPVKWDTKLFADDLKTYAHYGIHNIVTFCFYVSPEYVRLYGHPDFLEDYGTMMSEFKK